MKRIPENLLSTYNLLTRAFPNGINQSEYEALINLLYEHMSDRNLSDVLVFFTEKDKALISNDIPKYYTGQNNQDTIKEVRRKLDENGFGDWVNED